MKNCLVIYLGNSFSENVLDYSKTYTYSVDLMDNKQNHLENIYSPLINSGYSVKTLILTNKHEKLEFLQREFSAIEFNYDEITDDELKNLYGYYWMRTTGTWGPGIFKAGARLLKVKDRIPKNDLYVIIRADAFFKKKINEMDINYDKINYLWPETDNQFFTEKRQEYINIHGDELVYFRDYKRVNGVALNIVPHKYFNVLSNYLWLEHMSLNFMLRDLSPFITLENDFHFICGTDKGYVTNTNICENPIYFFNKKIYQV